jgi:hypothetical protein
MESRAELSLSTLWSSFSYHFFFAGTAAGVAAGGALDIAVASVGVAEAGIVDGVLGFALGGGAFAPSLSAPEVDKGNVGFRAGIGVLTPGFGPAPNT